MEQGIWLTDNEFGLNNVVSDNAFNYDVQTIKDAILVNSFQHATYCANNISGFGIGTRGFNFAGVCTETNLTSNILTFAGSASLAIQDVTMIGTQDNKGNEWHNLFGIESSVHAECESDPADNKFIVHTPQSTCANENDPCFSKYHPRKIDPLDPLNPFFSIDPFGTPEEACMGMFTIPGTDDLDRKIGQGLFTVPNDNPAIGWTVERYLYHKLMNNPSLINEHFSFPSFISNKTNGSVGRFYQIHKSIEEALLPSENIGAQSQQALKDIGLLIESLVLLDEQIESAPGNELQSLLQAKQLRINQIQSLQSSNNNLNATYQSQLATNLQSAYALNESVSTAYAYETNEKVFNQIYLLSLMQQGGELTESQVLTLISIAEQNPKLGGPAVHAATALLPDCVKPEILQTYLPSSEKNMHESSVSPIDNSKDRASSSFADNKVLVYPNPAQSAFLVKGPWEGRGTLMLYDIQGRLVLSKVFAGSEVVIELAPDTSSGVYMIKILMENGTFHVDKLAFKSK